MPGSIHPGPAREAQAIDLVDYSRSLGFLAIAPLDQLALGADRRPRDNRSRGGKSGRVDQLRWGCGAQRAGRRDAPLYARRGAAEIPAGPDLLLLRLEWRRRTLRPGTSRQPGCLWRGCSNA